MRVKLIVLFLRISWNKRKYQIIKMFCKISAKNNFKTLAPVPLKHLPCAHSLTQQSLCTRFTPGAPFSVRGHSVAANWAAICHQMMSNSWRSWQKEHWEIWECFGVNYPRFVQKLSFLLTIDSVPDNGKCLQHQIFAFSTIVLKSQFIYYKKFLKYLKYSLLTNQHKVEIYLIKWNLSPNILVSKSL